MNRLFMRGLRAAVASLFVLAGVGAASAQAIFQQPTANAAPRTINSKLSDIVSVKDFAGVVCNGTNDDGAGLANAFAYASANGKILDGQNASCVISSALTVPDGLDYRNFRITATTGGLKTLLSKTSGSGPVTLINGYINRNGDPADTGDANSGSGVDFIASGTFTGVYVENLEVTGDGPGGGYRCFNCNDQTIKKLNIHDITVSRATNPGTEMVIGAWVSGANIYVESPRVTDLLVKIGAGTFDPIQTDGFDCSGCDGLTMVGGFFKNISEHVDITGSNHNNNVWLKGNSYEDCGNVCEKWVLNVTNSGSDGSRFLNAGKWASAVGGGSGGAGGEPANIRISNAISVNAGASTSDVLASGFAYLATSSTPAANVQCINCQSIDNQGSPTMRYGFYNDVGSTADWTIVDPVILNAVTSDYLNKPQVLGFGSAGMAWAGPTAAKGAFNATGGVGTDTAFQQRGASSGSTIIGLTLRNTDSTSTSTCVSQEFRPNTSDDTTRAAAIVSCNTGSPANSGNLKFFVNAGGGQLNPLTINTDQTISSKAPIDWVDAINTWTYASATTFTVAADITGRLQVGDRIKLTQTTDKYFYITALSFSSPNTTVTVTGGSDYTLANAAITNPQWSRSVRPFGFPSWFNYSPTYGGFTATIPTNAVSRFNITGRIVTLVHSEGTNGVSNDTIFTVSLPVPAATISNVEWYSSGPFVDNGSSSSVFGLVKIVSAATVANLYSRADEGAWTAGSTQKRFKGFAIQYGM